MDMDMMPLFRMHQSDIDSPPYAAFVSVPPPPQLTVTLKHAAMADVAPRSRAALLEALGSAAKGIFPEKPTYAVAEGASVFIQTVDLSKTTVAEAEILVCEELNRNSAAGCTVAPSRTRLVKEGATRSQSVILDQKWFSTKPLKECGVDDHGELSLEVCCSSARCQGSSPITMKPGAA